MGINFDGPADEGPGFVGIKFCQECNNMLYPKEDKENRVLLYAAVLSIKASILENARKFGRKKNAKEGKHKKLEEKLVKWLLQARSSAINIDGPILKEKANFVAQRHSAWASKISRHQIGG
ncbi:hypothetical protein HPB51_017665 [Rhipicephalus microplus]|uniref:HTH CENPB-type domain-containing protein n=1 Tax=Rhipicephalus microplus TaxID=6941 RepID=A0A9J6E1W6_RHIMP|nr:hypothetical protein HPB51_017665 [Rhipicephalus microplus]